MPPIEAPFPYLASKKKAAKETIPVREILFQKFLRLVLGEAKKEFNGPWCLPRYVLIDENGKETVATKKRSVDEDSRPRKRSRVDVKVEELPSLSPDQTTGAQQDPIENHQSLTETAKHSHTSPIATSIRVSNVRTETPKSTSADMPDDMVVHDHTMYIESASPVIRNPSSTRRTLATLDQLAAGVYLFPESSSSTGDKFYLPPNSTALLGNIMDTSEYMLETVPSFDFILMDPPWPNRSARRKRSYDISYNSTDIKTLLNEPPLNGSLAENGFIAVWITNKESFRQLVLEKFEDWNVHLVQEWTWLKITSQGDPICALDSTWKKPYETLLVGKRRKSQKELEEIVVERKVIMAVPDLHSRKPGAALLKELICGEMGGKSLEIFARNLTAGWFSWGNEVLKFQGVEHWRSGATIEKTVVKQDSAAAGAENMEEEKDLEA